MAREKVSKVSSRIEWSAVPERSALCSVDFCTSVRGTNKKTVFSFAGLDLQALKLLKVKGSLQKSVADRLILLWISSLMEMFSCCAFI